MSSTNDILASALACTGTTVYRGSGSSYTGVLPDNNFKWGAFVVIVADGLRYVWAQSSANNYAMNFYNGSSWTGWQVLALKSDIAQKEFVNSQLHYGGDAICQLITSALGKNEFMLLVEEINTTNFILAHMRWNAGTVPAKTVISNSVISFGAANTAGTQVINGYTGTGGAGTFRWTAW